MGWEGFMDNYESEFITSAHMLLVKIQSYGWPGNLFSLYA